MFGQILQWLFDIVINIQQDKEKKTDWEQIGIIFPGQTCNTFQLKFKCQICF